MIVNDAVGALRCGTDDSVGVAAVLGTYCAVAGRNAAGDLFHFGFWPDSTGASMLGSEALAAIWRHMLDLGPSTSLIDRALERWGCADVGELLYEFTRIGGHPPSEPGRFADAVLDEAEAGDAVAREIVETAGRRLGDYARVCAARTGQLGSPFPARPHRRRHAPPVAAPARGDPRARARRRRRLPGRRARRRRPPPRRRRDRRSARPRPPASGVGGGDRRLMGGIRLEATTKIYPNGVKAIDDVTLDIRDGEFMVLVGPSGCGKSTLLRMIAGLEEVTEGRVLIGDEDVTDLRPRDRDIAMVFQNYALYPHMSVDDNLGFGLKLRRVPRDGAVRAGSARSRARSG